MASRQANDAVASTKITIIIYKRVFHVAVNTYVAIFRGLDARGSRKLYEQTHTDTCGTTTVMLLTIIIVNATALGSLIRPHAVLVQ